MKFAKSCVNFCCLLAVNSVVIAQERPSVVTNPSFEIADETSTTKLLGWRTTGDGSVVQVDTIVKHSGKQSLQIWRKAGSEFSGIAQAVDATPFRGKGIVLKAALRYDGQVDGPINLWLRADGASQRNLSFVNSYQSPPSNDALWVERRTTMMVVPEDATQLLFGAVNGGSGRLWVDDIALVDLEEAGAAQPPSEAAAKYLKEAISKTRAIALNADKVDWAKTEKIAAGLLAGAINSQDTYSAVSFMLKQLVDRHSHLIPATEATRRAAETRVDNFSIESERLDRHGYLSIPGYVGGNQERATAFVDDIRQRISTLASGNTCGWIVDLRNNTGGNMWPMIAGLSPLIGEGLVGLFESPKAKSEWRVGSNGDAIIGQSKTSGSSPASFIDGGKASVAVLTGPRTASSGEAVAVAFRGRPNTRAFGTPTAGLTTANTTVAMSDGAMLAIMVSVYVDRTGAKYGGKLIPDESVDGATKNLSDDPVVKAAAKWLNAGAGCQK
ncbi:MAG: S41 family peptidase [Aeromicrobium sp.]|nr:S41 family peptidase [Burkholderiales bacterium]